MVFPKCLWGPTVALRPSSSVLEIATAEIKGLALWSPAVTEGNSGLPAVRLLDRARRCGATYAGESAAGGILHYLGKSSLGKRKLSCLQ